MLKEGIYVVGFSYPVVPKVLTHKLNNLLYIIQDKARIRVQLSASHTIEQIDKCVDAFISIGKRLGLNLITILSELIKYYRCCYCK